ncbi:MAG: single-stranded-DNA-specific exonuclease RecJ, partial [Sphaerochaetaceae bacterium]|nr:single-stranded-DNA-specific exonuclease RecJ [Sphaerochaetaceae bacterium]
LEEENEITIDTTLKEEMFNKDLMKIIENLEPYGEQWEPVKFLIEKARIENLSAMQNSKDLGSAHLRMTLAFGTYKWPAVFWSAGQRVGKDFSDGEIVDVVFRMGRNYYKNQELIQLTVLDLRKH